MGVLAVQAGVRRVRSATEEGLHAAEFEAGGGGHGRSTEGTPECSAHRRRSQGPTLGPRRTAQGSRTGSRLTDATPGGPARGRRGPARQCRWARQSKGHQPGHKPRALPAHPWHSCSSRSTSRGLSHPVSAGGAPWPARASKPTRGEEEAGRRGRRGARQIGTATKRKSDGLSRPTREEARGPANGSHSDSNYGQS